MSFKHLFAIAAVAVLSGSGPLLANCDVCTSPEFRTAFLEGQLGVIIDYTSPSPNLVAMGNQVLPCLVQIAEHGGDVLGIDTCIEGEHGCEGWALATIRMIGTPEARQYLIGNLDREKEHYQIRIAIREVGILRELGARPRLRKLLKHPDPLIRLETLVSLGAIGDRSDFDLMIETAIALPDDQLRAAANGFQILGDPRAFGPLEKRIETVADPKTRRWTASVLADWRSRIAEEERLLSILRTASGWDLYKVIQNLPSRSDKIRNALLDLLDHEDPRARAESVKALARFNNPPDFERLLEVTLALPCTIVLIGAQGIEQFNDARAIEPLEKYAGEMKSLARQRELIALADRIRRRTSATPAP